MIIPHVSNGLARSGKKDQKAFLKCATPFDKEWQSIQDTSEYKSPLAFALDPIGKSTSLQTEK